MTPLSAPRGSGRAIAVLLGCLGLVALSGCSLPQAQPDLTRYYVLTSSKAPAPESGTVEPRAEAAKPRIFISAVSVPEYLRGRIVVVRLGPNELRYVDDSRWAEPLEPGLARVLRESLAAHPGVRIVFRPTDEHDYDVNVQVRHCEGVVTRRAAHLAAHVEIITAGNDPKVVAQDDYSLDVAGWDGKDYAALTSKLSEAAVSLAEHLTALLPQRKP